jgi:glutamate-1-semialdehyde aminotransferase
VIVRLTADCPLLDPEVIDHVVGEFFTGDFDYVSNTIRPTYPDGLDTEVVGFSALDRAWREATLPSDREHVLPYIWSRPEVFRLKNVARDADMSHLRWTVDEPRDLEFVRRVYDHFGHSAEFGIDSVLALLTQDTGLSEINAGITRNAGYQRSREADGAGESHDGPGGHRVSGRGVELYRRAKTRIPGGTQLLSKRPEMFLPDRWPSYYDRARGVEVWDLDGRRYIDMSYNGIGACVLGAADPDVNAAVHKAIDAGSMSTLNAPEEVELADLLCELHPWAEMVRYTRSGGEAMAVAVRIARAATGRERIAFCGYHGWSDWYLAANLSEERALDGHLLPGLNPAGVARGLAGTALPFQYNQIGELEQIVAAHEGQIAAIVMEPMRDHSPAPGFLQSVRRIADRIGAVLVLDEITAAFRINTGGAHLTLGIEPDMAVFAKAISNGYPMAAIIGRRDVMQAAQNTFISSTSWTERVGPVAALATIRKFAAENVAEHLCRIGGAVQQGWKAAAVESGLPIQVGGMLPLSHFSFEQPEPLIAQTAFTQLMLDRGFLAGKAFYSTYAHQDEHVHGYLAAVREVFSTIQEKTARGTLHQLVAGSIAHAGFRRLT